VQSPPPLPGIAPSRQDAEPVADYYFDREKDILFKNKVEADAVYAGAVQMPNPQSAEDYALRGKIHAYMGNYDEAIADYSKALDKEDAADTLTNRAFAFHYKNGHDSLIVDANLAIAKDGNLIYAYIARGYGFSRKEEYDKSILDFTRVIQAIPDYMYAYMWRGEAYRNIKAFEKSIADCTKAIALKPDRADLHYSRARTYEDMAFAEKPVWENIIGFQENCDKAIDDRLEGIKLDPTAYTAFMYCADTCCTKIITYWNVYAEAHQNAIPDDVGKKSIEAVLSAIALYEKALELKGGDPETLRRRAAAYSNLAVFMNVCPNCVGKNQKQLYLEVLKKAVADYTAVINSLPGNSENEQKAQDKLVKLIEENTREQNSPAAGTGLFGRMFGKKEK
jgi:tetratricopeptide (TPR) repeat protein